MSIRKQRSGEADLARAYDVLERHAPCWLAGAIRWLRHPNARLFRIPIGLGLIAGSLLAVLPIFGIAMLPIGLLVLAQDVPFLRGPAARMMLWLEKQFFVWRRRLGRWWRGR
jgi:hypothetical protein